MSSPNRIGSGERENFWTYLFDELFDRLCEVIGLQPNTSTKDTSMEGDISKLMKLPFFTFQSLCLLRTTKYPMGKGKTKKGPSHFYSFLQIVGKDPISSGSCIRIDKQSFMGLESPITATHCSQK